jgi:hypothetical protein
LVLIGLRRRTRCREIAPRLLVARIELKHGLVVRSRIAVSA